MNQSTVNELRAQFEIQIKQNFFRKPEFPFLQSMGVYNVFFPVSNENYDFGFLILEWVSSQNNTWISTWVDNEEQLNNYQYKYNRESIIDSNALAQVFAVHTIREHHKRMMREVERQKQDEEDWPQYDELHRSQPKPYLN